MVTREDIFAVMEGMGSSVDPSQLKADVPLASQGFDSLDLATLMLELEAKFGKPLPPEKAAKLRSLTQLLDYLNR